VGVSDSFDVCIVGAGPAGATCAYYLAKAGVRVALLEKESFPREKLCGEAVCSPGHVHLRRMGVLQSIERDGLGHWARIGGLVSPAGISFVGNSAQETRPPLVIAIRRMVLDERIARAAASAGVTLIEDYSGSDPKFEDGHWTLLDRRGEKPAIRARVLVAADGALSRIARSLGIVTTQPDATCSRAYVESDSVPFDADGVVYYPRDLLPGYCALFREAGGILNFCVYLIPGGKLGVADIKAAHEDVLNRDPYVRAALGPNVRIDKMRAAPLRLGGVPKSYADHVLLVGDAAGQIDPLTGEGIHFAMDAAEMAAQVLIDALAKGDLGAASLKLYEDHWRQAFGREFYWSARIAKFYARYPVFLDGAAALVRKRGASFLQDWAEAMTGAVSKSVFLRPGMAFPLLGEVARQWIT
jgi:geranylgeranyl reductase family protein